ncbi:hypothetical protein ACF1BK_10640 [Streptomyces globisporus]|uniref:SRPBCC family protein n=1 Tax=Streptomyces globisporus TaxID=1908 RepID=UPI0036FA0942
MKSPSRSAEITEQIPDERVAWTSAGGEAKQAGVVTFHYIDDNTTKIMLQLDYDPKGLAETVGDKLGFVKRQATGDLKRFKQFIESAAPRPAAARHRLTRTLPDPAPHGRFTDRSRRAGSRPTQGQSS